MPDSDAPVDHPQAPPLPVRRWNIGQRLGEVFLIAVGVSLGLAGEQWRDRADRHERAGEALRRIRAELAANRDEVSRVTDYHAKAREQLRTYFSVPESKRSGIDVKLEGIRPAQFEQTAWQLAQATQALVDIDSQLSFDLARIYGVQARYVGLSEGITQAMYLRPPGENMTAFLHSLAVYYSDVVVLEPGLEKLYAEMLPRLDAEIAR